MVHSDSAHDRGVNATHRRTDRFGGLIAFDTRREVDGADGARSDLVPELHAARPPGSAAPRWPRPARNWTSWPPPWPRQDRRGRDKVEAEIESITRKPWVRRVITWQLAGDQPKDLRLTWQADPAAAPPGRRAIRQARPDHQPRPLAVPRSSPATGPSPRPSSPSAAQRPPRGLLQPMFHWTEHNIRVHVFTCVLACRSPPHAPPGDRQHRGAELDADNSDIGRVIKAGCGRCRWRLREPVREPARRAIPARRRTRFSRRRRSACHSRARLCPRPASAVPRKSGPFPASRRLS